MVEELQETEENSAYYLQSPLKNYVHWMRIRNDETLRKAMRNDVTRIFWKDLFYRVDNRLNFNLQIGGLQGSGKSTSARLIKYLVDEHTNTKTVIDDICFTRDDALKRVSLANAKSVIINDEDYDYVTQIGATRKREQQEVVEQVIRQEQINLISCSVSRVPHLFTYKLEAFDIGKGNENRLIVYDQINNMAFSSQPIGIIQLDGNLLKQYVEIEAQYQALKNKFTGLAKVGKIRDVYAQISEMGNELVKLYNYKAGTPKDLIRLRARQHFPHLSETELAELTNYVYFIKSEAKYLQKTDDEIKIADPEIIKEQEG